MRKTYQRIVSAIVAVSVLLGIFSLCFGAFADDEPALTLRSSIVISKSGINADFGEKYNEIASKTKITLSPVIDLSGESVFEFDILIEDFASFKNAVSSEWQGLGFLFGSNTSTKESFHTSRNYASFDITDQIKSAGWNHISAKKADFVENSINWTNVRFIFLKFSDNSTAAYPENNSKSLKNTAVKLRNICSVAPMPEISEASVKIYSDYFSFLANQKPAAVSVDKTDLSGCSHIGFDYRASDTEAFNALIASGKVKLIL